MCLKGLFSRWFGNPKLVCPDNYMEELSKSTVLTNGQIRHLYKRFCLIGGLTNLSTRKFLKKRDFLSIAHLSRNPLLSIILGSMFADKRHIDFIEFVQYLSTFEANYLHTKKEQIEATTKKKKRLLFDMYDRNKDGRISRRDLIIVIHKLFGDVIKPSKVAKMADIMMNEMDLRETDFILYDDFCNALGAFDMTECLVMKIPEA